MMTKRWSVWIVAAAVVAAVGCRSTHQGPDPIAPEETVAGAPTAGLPGVEGASTVHYYGPRPPPARREERGAAPSPRHFWSPGYHRWDGREHVWHPGGWYERRDGHEYI